MYGVAMEITIKTLLSQGQSERKISSSLGISRNVIRRVKREMAAGSPPGRYHREQKLSPYESEIKELLGKDLSTVLIHDRLVSRHGLSVSYSTVRRFVRQLEQAEVYIPLHSEPGEEAQVDFGYLGRFEREGSWVKVWVFCMLLSHSRYAYYEAVTDQSVATFLRCHQHSFEYFGGVTQVVKLDNLKAGVIKPDFYEPLIQEQYAAMLAHYGSAPVTARVRRPQDKGKVESGIKYVKNNFFKGLDSPEWEVLVKELSRWNEQVCNARTHGTTHKVPAVVFEQVEKGALLPLAPERFEIFRIETRKVNRLAHITFGSNYYSVPHTYVGQSLTVKSNGRLLRVYDQQKEVAVHQLAQGKGHYISLDQHKPPGKREKDLAHYLEKAQEIGPHLKALVETIYDQNPNHWRDKARGLISLKRRFPLVLIDKAAKRALDYQAYTYLTVKNICERNILDTQSEDSLPEQIGGFGHPLAIYDQLTQ